MSRGDTIPRHIEAEIALLGVIPQQTPPEPPQRPKGPIWVPSHPGEQPPF